MEALQKAMVEAGRNHGVLHRGQALACGMTPRQIGYRLHIGHWRRLHPKVYLMLPARPTFEARCAAALLAVGPGAVLVGRTAAYLLGWIEKEPQDPVEVLFHRRSRIQGIRIHVDPQVKRYPRITCNGFRIAPIEVSLFFAARSSSQQMLTRMVQEARKKGLRDEKLLSVVDRLGVSGSNGTKMLRQTLSATLGHEPTDSTLEDLFLPHLLRRALAPQLQYPIRIGGRVVRRGDFVFPEIKIDGETDGRPAHHGDRFDKDRSVDRLLMKHGWLVPRYTWRDITEDPRSAADHLAALVRARRRQDGFG